MRSRSKFIVLLTSVTFCSSVLAQGPAAQIDALFSKFITPREPGCAVLVVKDDRAVFRKGYGVTHLRTFNAITPATNFRLASLTKQFTATAVMLLVHDGKLHFDDSLPNVFPDFPAYGRAITVRNLLNHTSGLLDYEDLMAEKYAGVPDERIPQIKDAGVLELMKQQSATRFPPGTRWEYSNSGYAVLAMVVEKVSGVSFGDFLRERIFKPAGMTRSVAYEKGKNEVPDRAYGHSKTAAGWKETDQSSTSAVLGDGGIYTSLDDLEKWDWALSHHIQLSAKEMEPAYTPATSSGSPLEKQSGEAAPRYGFGWFLDPYRGHRRYSHYGETVGFRNAIQRFPGDHLTVVVLCNRADRDGTPLAESVVDLFLGKR
jgi:CubicO group peptidase (beta-lactamase class C family)